MSKIIEIYDRIEIGKYPKRINALGYFKKRINEKIVTEIDDKGKKLVKEMKDNKTPTETLKDIKKDLIQLSWLKDDVLDLLRENFTKDKSEMYT